MALSTTRKRILWGGAGLLVLAAILGVTAYMTGFFGGEEGLEVSVTEAETRDVTQVVTAFGRAQPEVEVTISPDVSGEVVELKVQEGDPVEKGDLLARLRPDNYVAQVEQAQAQVSQARAQLAERRADSLQAQLELQRQKKLYEREAISESAFQQARTQYQQAAARLEAARYSVESATAALRDARERLAKTRIFAPMDGTVSRLNVEQGERVVGTERVQGTEMMRIARLDQMELEVEVNENDVVNVALRDTASIGIDAYPERSFRGVVTEIANSARTSNSGTQEQTTNFPVKVRVLDAHNEYLQALAPGQQGGTQLRREEVPTPPEEVPMLRPGMSGTVDIFTQTASNTIAVPIQAVTVRDFADVRSRDANASGDGARSAAEEDLREVVFVAEGDSARMVEVTTGISDDTHIAIRSGLDGGERVITGPYSAVSRELKPGHRIRVQGGSASSGEALASAE
jgi:HlyD family secretion protein